jgi:transcriptional regulator with XRE-family HTH domain
MPTPNPALGNKIRDWREAKDPKWSQERLARELQVTRGTVFNVETGKTTPDLGTLLKIAEVLDVDLQELADLAKPLEEAGAA